MNSTNLIGGVILLLAAAALAIWANPVLVSVILMVLLVLVGLALIFGADDKARALVVKWWGLLRAWFLGNGGWSFWEAVALGLVIFGFFAGPDFLGKALLALVAFLAPWLAGLWASRRGTPLPTLLGTAAGTLVGVVEGWFFLAWLPSAWRDFPAWLLALVLAGLAGAGLGFWACARGRLKMAKVE